MPQRASKLELTAEVLNRFGSTRITVQGSSMLPNIRPGDEIEVQSTPLFKIKQGDILAYRRDDRLFVHRVIEIDAAGRLLTHGDTLPQADPPVLESELLGIVTNVNRGGSAVPLRRSIVDRAAAAIFRRSRLCTALFVKLTYAKASA